MSTPQSGIVSTMQEHRIFPPSSEFSKKAWIQSKEQYEQLYRESIDHPDQFWGKIAEELHWFKKWDKVLDWQNPYAKWFIGAKTNLSHNCLDAQIEKGRGDKTAILWEGEPLGSSTPAPGTPPIPSPGTPGEGKRSEE